MAVEVITNEARCDALHRAILTYNPVHGRYAHIRQDPDGNLNREDLRAALRRGVALVRLQPAVDAHDAAETRR